MNRKWKLRKLILAFGLLTALVIWLVWPLSQSGREMYARINMELLLFDCNKVNPRLFRGPIIKYNEGREWFEWHYVEGKDTIAVGIASYKLRFLNYFPPRAYFLGKDSLWKRYLKQSLAIQKRSQNRTDYRIILVIC